MPRIRVYLGCSLDGCIAGPDHDISFLHDAGTEPGEPGQPGQPAEPTDAHPAEPPAAASPAEGLSFEAFLDQVGAVLMGRRTYQVPLDHQVWPYGDRPVLVATHRPLPPAPEGGDARPVQGPIQDLIAQARQAAGGRDVYLDGGDLVRQGLEAGLVDELCLTFLPVVLGQGIRLWDGLRSRSDLVFEPPALLDGRMVQVRARVLRGR